MTVKGYPIGGKIIGIQQVDAKRTITDVLLLRLTHTHLYGELLAGPINFSWRQNVVYMLILLHQTNDTPSCCCCCLKKKSRFVIGQEWRQCGILPKSRLIKCWPFSLFDVRIMVGGRGEGEKLPLCGLFHSH